MWSPCKAWVLLFTRWASFTGRSTRGELWYALLMECIWMSFVYAVNTLFMVLIEQYSPIFLLGLWLILLCNVFYQLLVYLPVNIRRLHDLNLSGAWFLLAFTPLFIFLYIFMLFMPSQHKTNRFGSDPAANIQGFYEYYSNRMHTKYGAYGLQSNHTGMSSSHERYNNFSGSNMIKRNMLRPVANSNLQNSNQNHYSSINSDFAENKPH